MTAATDSSNYTGFLEMDTGLPAIESIKSSISPYGPLKNILRVVKSTDRTTNQPVAIVDLYCPTVTLTSGAAEVESAGYANLAPGSQIRCANGIAVKVGAVGTDTWASILATA